jgi:hypothetical protein
MLQVYALYEQLFDGATTHDYLLDLYSVQDDADYDCLVLQDALAPGDSQTSYFVVPHILK